MNNLITIMIPAYNAEKYIGRCLESLKNQTYQDIEIVIVNDGSKDQTQSICEEYVCKDSRFRLLNQKNGGEGAARNTGIREAKGQFLCFVDADDYVDADFIENMYQMHMEHEADLVICGFTELKDSDIINQTSGPVEIMNQEDAMEKLLREDSFKGYVWNKMFNMQIVRDNQMQFDGSLAVWTDVLFVFQYMLHIKKAVFNPRPTYNYIYVENSASHLANHLLGVEKSYSAIRAKEQMVDKIPAGYDKVKKQLGVRYVQSALAVIRNIGYTGVDKSSEYYQNSLDLIKTYKNDAYAMLSRKDKILVQLCSICPGILMILYHLASMKTK